MAATITIGSENTPRINFTVKDADGVVVNLTDATVTFTAKILLPPKGNAGSISKTCILDVPASGMCYCELSADDTKVPGEYTCELYIHWDATSDAITSTRFTIEIVKTLFAN